MPFSNKEYFFYTIRDASIQIVYDLLFGQGSFVSGYKTSSDFMNYDGGSGISNKDRILSKYSSEEKIDHLSKTNYDQFLLKYGTIILLPFAKVDRDIITLLGDNVVSTNVSSFLANTLRETYNDAKHVRKFAFNKKTLGSYKEMFMHISVWVWSRALSCKIKDNDIIEYDDTIINVTPYINDIATTVNQNGGAFNFTLDSILGKFRDKWEIDEKTIKKTKTEHVVQSNISDLDLQRQKLFFENVLQENDIVFIRFETLKNEEDRIDKKTNTFEIDKNELQFKSFDLIGLIDSASPTTNFANNELSINVVGRDLMKLFIEDGTYFYPLDYISGGIFANESDEDRLARYDGQLISKFQIGYKKIENVLKFIINALGTIKICSDTLFEPYRNLGYLNKESSTPFNSDFEKSRDRRTHKYKIGENKVTEVATVQSDTNLNLENESIQAIKDSRRDSNFTNYDDDFTARSIYNGLIKFCQAADSENALHRDGTWDEFRTPDNSIIKANQYPDQLWGKLYYYENSPSSFVQPVLFLSNDKTEKKKYKSVKAANTTIVPTKAAQNAVKVIIRNYFGAKDRKENLGKAISNINYESEPLKGIWQIVKLIIDKNVHNRIVADSSIGNEHGSLLNGVRKVCQDPFVEFYGDTYGDQYYLTVRKPPFDREGILSLLEGAVLDEDGVKVSSSPIIIDINDEDILTENLSYGGPAYSWYKLNLNSIGGDSMALAYLRAIYLKEYADIFGSKPLDISTNYIPYTPLVSKDALPSEAYMIKQGIYDLQFLIQSHAYLPFIRKGVITLANGDRRIKRGTLVRLVSTGEVGLVEAVTNYASISLNNVDRTTTLSVDRIMVEKYIRGVSVIGSEIEMSYFNLINTHIDPKVFEQNKSYIDFNKEVLAKWKVNPEVLNFFLQKRQFA